MQLIRCTQKLLKELKVDPVDTEPPDSFLGSWHANLLRFEQRKCVLFTNDQTVFSIFVPGLVQSDFKQLAQIFGQNLFRYLRLEGFSQEQIERVLDEYQTIQFAKTNNRSVLGSMNDLAYQLNWLVQSNGGLSHLSLDHVHHQLNRIPMSAIKEHCYSIDALKNKFEQ